MQELARPWSVCVYGTASVRARPDLARIRFRVVRIEPTAAGSFEAVRSAVGEVRRVLRGHGVPDPAVAGSELDLETLVDHEGGQRVLGHRCQASFVVETPALDGVQRLLTELVAAGADRIDGVHFGVANHEELRAEARRRAVAVARAKAELYAEAAGGAVGRILHIEDLDRDQRAVPLGFAGHGPSDDLTPGHVAAAATVLLGFALEPLAIS
jgi:uncharacterized protein YggE